MHTSIRTAALLLVLLTAIVRPAQAGSGSFEDPRDSVGKLDIERISHRNDDETATYRLDTYQSFEIADVFGISWEFDFNNDGNTGDACALMKRIGTTSTLRASFYGGCGQETWATADAKVGDRSIEFSLPLIDLVESGGLQPGNGYSYRVTVRDDDGAEDSAPERGLAVHEDVPAPTPRPGSAGTELGFEGDAGTRTGAGGGARTAAQAREDGPIDAEGNGAASIEGETGEARAARGPEFRFGPVPLCSGSFCFAVAVGAPAIAAAISVLIRAAIRRRRIDALEPLAPGLEDVGAGAEFRSYPGHV